MSFLYLTASSPALLRPPPSRTATARPSMPTRDQVFMGSSDVKTTVTPKVHCSLEPRPAAMVPDAGPQCQFATGPGVRPRRGRESARDGVGSLFPPGLSSTSSPPNRGGKRLPTPSLSDSPP